MYPCRFTSYIIVIYDMFPLRRGRQLFKLFSHENATLAGMASSDSPTSFLGKTKDNN